MAERVRLPGSRVSGKVLSWKGKFGWIQPSTPIKHKEASKNGGKVYLAQEDVDSDVSVGAAVNFFVYSDGKGLGAMHCRAGAAAGGAKGNVKAVAKAAAPKVQTAQRAAKITGKFVTPGVQQKYVAVKGQTAIKTVIKKTPKLQPTAKSMPSPEGIKGVSQVPDRKNRQRLTQRISGTLQKWRGEIGWIKPDAKLEGIKKNQIYVHNIDFKQGDESLVGSAVTFFVYQDEAGVGAEHVIVASGASPKAVTAKAVTTGKKPAFTPKTLTKSLLPQPKMKGQKAQGQLAPKMTMLQKTKRNRRSKNKGAGGEKQPRASADLPRTRITTVSVSGEVVEWKGKFGWVKAADKIEHEKAGQREGKLYVNAKDIVGGEELTVGQSVEFHIYEDSSGLGAEECVAV